MSNPNMNSAQGRRQVETSGRSSLSTDTLAPRLDPLKRISKANRYHGSQRTNQSLEDEQTRKWVAEEDNFVLKQSKKKAGIRVREGRAKPIDWLAVILRVIDPDKDLLEDDEEDIQCEGLDPESIFEGLNDAQLAELNKDILSYLTLEKNKTNIEYWKTMETICEYRRQRINPLYQERRAVSSVTSDVEKLLSPKTYEQLEALEKQIKFKLQSNLPVDVDYWDHLLWNLNLWKAKAKLKKVYQSVIDSRLDTLRKQHQEEADMARSKMQKLLSDFYEDTKFDEKTNTTNLSTELQQPSFSYSRRYDPDPLLKLDSHDKMGGIVDETNFLKKVVAERQKTLKLGIIPQRQLTNQKNKSSSNKAGVLNNILAGSQRYPTTMNDDISQTTKALYEREAARGIDEDEEIFTGEELVATVAKPQWADKYRPRKPRYFNRVQMGYEWNKYNQTHYDHDNPPPKVVQGYKFNIFYPDLIDKAKAPTFKIIRENGRKRGMSFAPAGEEDTCLIRFIAGPPYEDIAFRIVDKEWDYSAKRDRGFRSSFDKGILQLHFQYKKIYYRK
ncbi:Uncharacterized protein C2F12.12c [Golovinomyces cichoracearum]|uniref:Splicing factor Cactin n=1 Tax=Golovinomyces cichoracearum TaxID=62708 RepID=A0A420IX09_9PEZI|nr:Uncharacterized protein C2F12.12c [Golovinomyces cichoracearum]